jgi:hypothetical protein
LSILLHDVDMSADRLDRFRLSALEVGYIRRINEASRVIGACTATGAPLTAHAIFELMLRGQDAMPAAICSVAAQPGFVDAASHGGDLLASLVGEYYDRYAPDAIAEPLVTGKDLLELGLKPGPAIGRLLTELRAAQMTGAVANRAAALELAKSLLRQRGADASASLR